jgi:hypothetical protein
MRQTNRKWFLVVVLTEVLGIALVSVLANGLHRADPATDWRAMIVGLHFLPLAKIFRAPFYVGHIFFECDGDLSLAWVWNPTLGHLRLLIVSSATNRELTIQLT